MFSLVDASQLFKSGLGFFIGILSEILLELISYLWILEISRHLCSRIEEHKRISIRRGKIVSNPPFSIIHT